MENEESVFVEVTDLRKEFKDRANDIPGSAVGLYNYYKRLKQGLQQFMCGARKFAPNYIDRGDILSLTKETANHYVLLLKDLKKNNSKYYF